MEQPLTVRSRIDTAESAVARALLLPFSIGALEWPPRTAFLRACVETAQVARAHTELICEQSFKPDADALRRAGLDVSADLGEVGEEFALVLVLPPRQRTEARALLARAVKLAGVRGRVVAAASNSAGARSLEQDLASLSGSIAAQSKHKCRVFWTTGEGRVATDRLTRWLALDAPRSILEGRFVSRPGVFAWDRIDPASALLAEHLPDSLSGCAADLGAGFGYLSHELLVRCPGIRALDVYEAEARALDMARINLAAHERNATIDYCWHDVTAGLSRTYDVIVTNPPFHSRRGADDPGLGRRFIAVAARALAPAGRLFLVANRHLPYESVLSSSFAAVRLLAQRHGFKIVEAARPQRAPP